MISILCLCLYWTNTLICWYDNVSESWQTIWSLVQSGKLIPEYFKIYYIITYNCNCFLHLFCTLERKIDKCDPISFEKSKYIGFVLCHISLIKGFVLCQASSADRWQQRDLTSAITSRPTKIQVSGTPIWARRVAGSLRAQYAHTRAATWFQCHMCGDGSAPACICPTYRRWTSTLLRYGIYRNRLDSRN